VKYIEPKLLKTGFTCPHCGVFSHQEWSGSTWDLNKTVPSVSSAEIKSSKCQYCGKFSVWISGKMYFPDKGNAPQPNPDMPDEVKNLYLEASSIHTKSPRGAAALLRLSIQVLCKELGGKGKNVSDDIAELVRKGLPEIVQQSLDIVRVTGNDAVHPGQIDTDDPDVVAQLFGLVNIICEYMISLPSRVSGLYSTLPATKLAEIEKRDKQEQQS
jgi:hypothetical protein